MEPASPDGRPADPATAPVSPGLVAGNGGGTAMELKFLLPEADARGLEAWARDRLRPDPYGVDGVYRVTTVYCDTPGFDVFHRSPKYKRNKLRLRRYGDAATVFLEKKGRRKGKVKKNRVEVPADELKLLDDPPPPPGWAGAWFGKRAAKKDFRPACRVAYRRAAFVGGADNPGVRLTLDFDLVGAPAIGWDATPPAGGIPLMPGQAFVELKFNDHLPNVFRDLLPKLPTQPARGSKYRRCVEVLKLTEVPPTAGA